MRNKGWNGKKIIEIPEKNKNKEERKSKISGSKIDCFSVLCDIRRCFLCISVVHLGIIIY